MTRGQRRVLLDFIEEQQDGASVELTLASSTLSGSWKGSVLIRSASHTVTLSLVRWVEEYKKTYQDEYLFAQITSEGLLIS